MGIQNCEKCGTTFNYIDVLDSVGWGHMSLICRKCEAKYKMKTWYLFIIAFLLILPIFLIYKVHSMTSIMPLKMIMLLIYVLYLGAILVLSPFVVKYNLEDEKQVE